jgi:AcrR family transcriptional regulator
MAGEGCQVTESAKSESAIPVRLDGPLHLDRPLRADAARTMHKILEVAEQVLSRDPAATLEKIAARAGVARTTVYRRFATREALVDAMSELAMMEIEKAIDEGRPETAPPMVAFHQITANLIEIKSGWRFTMNQANALHGTAAEIHDRIYDKCLRLLKRAQATGAIRPEVDLIWARGAYHALIEQAFRERAETDGDPDALAERLLDTLFNGIGPGRPG